MPNEAGMVLALSAVMGIASFLAGMLPLSFTLSQSRRQLMSAAGMGVLVGTSLVVIIPEGIETLYGAASHGHSHGSHSKTRSLMTKDLRTSDILGREAHDSKGNSVKPESSSSSHGWVGLALLLGFILMYLIDEIPRYLAANKRDRPAPFHISLDNLSRGPHRSSSASLDQEHQDLDVKFNESPARSMATTTGLVIHSAADGIALGASSSTGNHGLGLVVFLAIMLHKAPAAFGLTSILLKQGLSKRKARAHLAIFSLAAPVGAILTWSVASASLVNRAADEAKTQWWTGFLLLFSGGTFLYVAMHAMQESSAPHSKLPLSSLADGVGSLESGGNERSISQIWAAIAGMTLPLITQIGHVH